MAQDQDADVSEPPIQFRKRRKKVRFSNSNAVSYFHHDHSADGTTITTSNGADSDGDHPIVTPKNAKFESLEDALNAAESKLKQMHQHPMDSKPAESKPSPSVPAMFEKEADEFNADDYECDEGEPLKYTESDILYDSKQDRIDEDYVHQKYHSNSVIQSQCTLCCANCFVFIAYVSIKDPKRQNKYRCFSLDNASVTVNAQNEVICECGTVIGTRQNITDHTLAGMAEEEPSDNEIEEIEEIEMQSNGKDECDEKDCGERDIWTLISSDFSTLTAPKLDVEQLLSVAAQETLCSDKKKGRHSKDSNAYLYHLVHVLPGLI